MSECEIFELAYQVASFRLETGIPVAPDFWTELDPFKLKAQSWFSSLERGCQWSLDKVPGTSQ